MNKALQALWKIDHTICMNSNEGNIKWNIDDKDDPTLYQNGEGYDPEDTDCKSFDDFCDCYDEIEKTLKKYALIEEVLEEYGLSDYLRDAAKLDDFNIPEKYPTIEDFYELVRYPENRLPIKERKD